MPAPSSSSPESPSAEAPNEPSDSRADGAAASHDAVRFSQADRALHGSRARRFLRGMELGLPIFLGYAPVGAAFGVLARSTGFSAVEAIVCSATALAGAGQFIALAALGAGSGAIAALAATTVVNLRYVLFATTLAPELHRVRVPVLAWLGFTLTDETFAVNIADRRQGLSTPAAMAGVGAIAWLGWVLGTVVGALAADRIGDPSRFGVEFAMSAMFAALFVALAEDARHVVVGLAAGVLAAGLPALGALGVTIPPAYVTVVAALGAATVAAVIYRGR